MLSPSYLRMRKQLACVHDVGGTKLQPTIGFHPITYLFESVDHMILWPFLPKLLVFVRGPCGMAAFKEVRDAMPEGFREEVCPAVAASRSQWSDLPP